MDTMTKIGVSLATGSVEHYDTIQQGKKSVLTYSFVYNGERFACIKPTLEECRNARDKWLLSMPINSFNEVTLQEASELFLQGELIMAYNKGGLPVRSMHYLSRAEHYFRNEETAITLRKALHLCGIRQFKLYKL